MMTSVATSKAWYEDIKTFVETKDPYFYTDGFYTDEQVEYDVADYEAFVKISRELGWMN